ncbi:MAG: hypothetical protein OEM67_07795 [Thermoleophilia bacterium]|nr:hypothetical protein [Thermoleophilia bacterium]
MKISRKRAPLALAGAAVAAALVALPATAAADESKATLIPHAYDGPTVDGEFGDWANIPYLNTEQNVLVDRGLIKAHYNCKTGDLTVAVRGVRNGVPEPVVQASGADNGSTGPYVDVQDLYKKLPDRKYTPDNAEYAAGDGGYEMALPLTSPGAYKLHYYAGKPAPAATASGLPDVEPLPYEISGYAYVKVHCPTLHIEKTATGRYDHIYDWSVRKAATVMSKDSKTPVVEYSIDVKRMGPRVINRDVVGTIKVTNHGHIDVPRVKVTDHGIGSKDLCRITGVKIGKQDEEYRKGENYVVLSGLAPKATAYVGYICHPHPDIPPHKLPKKPVNKASVSWAGYAPNGDNGNNGVVSGSLVANGPKNIAWATQGFQFKNLDDVYKEDVHLFDRDHSGKKKHLGLMTASKTMTYTTKLHAPRRGCKVYANTASLVDLGNKTWNPRSTARVKICRSKDGSVTAVAKNPAKPSVDYDKRRRCYVNLRTRIAGPSTISRRGAIYRLQVGNRGKLAAGNVKAKLSVPKGLKIVAVRGIARAKVKIRGRHLYVSYKWVPRGRGRTLAVKVRPDRRARTRAHRGVIRFVAKHNCDIDGSRKRVRWGQRPNNDNPNNDNGNNDNGQVEEE